MFVVGAVCVAIGWAWNAFFPINKALWTSSYVLFTGGLALQFLSICYWLIDIKGYRRWAKPFEVFGLNAIALYVVADVIAMLLGTVKVGGAPLGGWIYDHMFASWASPINASLAFAICFVLVCLGLMWILYTPQDLPQGLDSKKSQKLFASINQSVVVFITERNVSVSGGYWCR